MKVFITEGGGSSSEINFVEPGSFVAKLNLLAYSLHVTLNNPMGVSKKVVICRIDGGESSWFFDKDLWTKTRPEDFESMFRGKYPDLEFQEEGKIFFENMKTLLELVHSPEESQKL